MTVMKTTCEHSLGLGTLPGEALLILSCVWMTVTCEQEP